MPATAIDRRLPPASPVVTTSLIDIDHDELIPVRELVKRRTGRSLSPACSWRWIKKGVKGHRLEAVFIFGQWSTTEAALGAFLTATTAAALANQVPPEQTVARRTAAKTERLRAAGLLK